MNRDNLRKLADYLAALPRGYAHFNMGSYHGENPWAPYGAVAPSECGTVACAMGHAPFAGIEAPVQDETWGEYSNRIFELSSEEWNWCFSGMWADIDNSVRGASLRIYWLLENGLPDNWSDQLNGCSTLCYMGNCE